MPKRYKILHCCRGQKVPKTQKKHFEKKHAERRVAKGRTRTLEKP